MTSGRPTNAVNAKVARKLMERTWNDSTIVDNRRKNRSVRAVAPVRADALWRVLTCSFAEYVYIQPYRFIRSQ